MANRGDRGAVLGVVARRQVADELHQDAHLGVIPGAENPGQTLAALAEAGADAFLVGPGTARRFTSIFTGRGAPGLILRVDWTNRWRGPDLLGSEEGRGRLIASVEDAARMGADAVLVYMFIGYHDPDAEARQTEDVARVSEACDRLGIGCIIEPMARGLRADHDIYRPEYIAPRSSRTVALPLGITIATFSPRPTPCRSSSAPMRLHEDRSAAKPSVRPVSVDTR